MAAGRISGAALAVVLAAACAGAVSAEQPQRSAVVAFWNVENLYDTIPSPFGGDADYTPQGRRRWNADRYRRKLQALARVLDDLSPDVVGLAEVESEEAVRDLVASLEGDYCYIHRPTDDRRGMDVALLYRADVFFPQSVRQLGGFGARQPLYVRGRLAGERVDLLVCHLPSKLNPRRVRAAALERAARWADSLAAADPEARPILAGDLNCDPSERLWSRTLGRTALYAPLAHTPDKAEADDAGAGREWSEPARGRSRTVVGGYGSRRWPGSYMYDGRWLLYDNILLSAAFIDPDDGDMRCAAAGVFLRRDMLTGDQAAGYRRGAPRRTFAGSVYEGGPSDHLPVYVVLEPRAGCGVEP